MLNDGAAPVTALPDDGCEGEGLFVLVQPVSASAAEQMHAAAGISNRKADPLLNDPGTRVPVMPGLFYPPIR
ncbi:hypothetical protein GCM10009753_13370 [Streptantibioticus ferralitis]